MLVRTMHAPSPNHYPSFKTKGHGFSLVELLVVMSVMSILIALVSMGFQAALGGSFSSAVSQMANSLIRARAYAMANNTYVFVGLQEVSAANNPAGPQTTGSGRIGMVTVATSDGSRGYPTPVAGTTIMTLPTSAFPTTQLTVVSPLTQYENLHFTFITAGLRSSLSGLPSLAAGAIDLSPSTTPALYKLGTSYTQFTWPLGASTPRYTFGGANSSTNITAVIQFTPQGEAQILNAANSDAYYQTIEIDLEPTHGTSVPATAKDEAALLIDGPSGGLSIYRS